jgi:uncharacterized protein with HEPN domain
MPRDVHVLLFDARTAAANVLSFLDGKTFGDYCESLLLRSAVERQLITLGEAVYQIEGRFRDSLHLIPEHRAIVRFRHVLTHHYDGIDDEVVWGIVQTKLPALIKTLDELLE